MPVRNTPTATAGTQCAPGPATWSAIRICWVGYMVNMKESEDVRAGKKSEDGRFTGPCRIMKKWHPFEISIVSIPADSTVGVGRELERTPDGASLSVYERQLQINKNIIGGNTV